MKPRQRSRVSAAIGLAMLTQVGAHSLPERLSESGLFADIARAQLAAGVIEFTPNYPLWTDGASKRRWILLPPDSTIDASDIDRWQFPIGTKLWKEFAIGERVETRMSWRIEDGSWAFASYRWLADGSDALLVDEHGLAGAAHVAEGVPYDIPSRNDCHSCHSRGRNSVLGFSAVQLQREFIAQLQASGQLGGFPIEALEQPAVDPQQRALLGYLHGNCGHCHNGEGAMRRAGFRLEQRLVEDASIAAFPQSGDPNALLERLQSHDPFRRMPPLGTRLNDPQILDLLSQWLSRQSAQPVPSLGEPTR